MVFSASWVNWVQCHLEEGSEDVVEGLGLVVEVDDEEGKGEGSDEDDEAESGFDDPFRDRVVHDRELAWEEEDFHITCDDDFD